jgi:hypothetical protein
MSITISNTAKEGLASSNPYRYAYAAGLLQGEIYNLEMDLKFGNNADIRRRAQVLVDLSTRIREEMDQKVTQ